jgi:thymidylate synthase
MIKKCISEENDDEKQYLKLIQDILKYGSLETNGRNGNVMSIFGASMHFSLENNIIPILTSKKIAWKTCLKELLWFISGSTNNQILIDNNVHIWNDNASRNFLDSRGLDHLQENDLGPVYGHQWRHFNAPYTNCTDNYDGKGVDQLQNIIDKLKDPVEKYSRRLIMSTWNPEQLDEMALPPCHVLVQFNVSRQNKLSCALYQRSGDVGLGVPFNITSYCFLTHIIAKHCNLEAYEFIYTIGNCHIYEDHIEPLKQQLQNNIFSFPTININTIHENINDYTINNINIQNYTCNKTIPMKMIV